MSTIESTISYGHKFTKAVWEDVLVGDVTSGFECYSYSSLTLMIESSEPDYSIQGSNDDDSWVGGGWNSGVISGSSDKRMVYFAAGFRPQFLRVVNSGATAKITLLAVE